MYSLSHIRLFETPSTVAHQAPLSMEFFRQEYWSGLLFPSPRDLPDPGIKPGSPVQQAEFLPTELPGKVPFNHKVVVNYARESYFFLIIIKQLRLLRA